jgi:hypothetical protein
VVEIANTGQISDEEQEQFMTGTGRGRGLQICTRLVKNMGGENVGYPGMEKTTFVS